MGSFRQLETLAGHAARMGKGLPVSVKFDTGMARLGFTQDDLPRLVERLREAPLVRPVMASSTPGHGRRPRFRGQGAGQAERFEAALAALAEAGFQVEANLANSAGILAHQKLRHQSQRGGIALYGANPLRAPPGNTWAAALPRPWRCARRSWLCTP